MTERIEVDAVPAALDGQRIDRVVSMVADVARSRASALVAEGRVHVDGQAVDKPSVKVVAGASLTIDLERPDTGLRPDPTIEITVVHEDDHVVVVDKAAGVVVHPGSGVTGGTLVEGLLAAYPDLAPVGPSERPGIVHRLDKGTSGLLMVARTSEALDGLAAQLRARTVDRRYRTVVVGAVAAEQGIIDGPLGRSSRDATRRAVVADGKPAVTHYEVMRRAGDDDDPDATSTGDDGGSAVSELVCRLETGRTHQIRAHLAAIGHPVLADGQYGGGSAGWSIRLDRPFLHAETLGFEHPITGRWLDFTSPLPPDLDEVIGTIWP